MTGLAGSFLTTPLAHRGLHDVAAGRPENSLAAIRAAISAGYGIELDIQRSGDGQAMVFHDYDLARMTPEKGSFHLRSADELTKLSLCGSDQTIPTLAQALDTVAGRAPVLLEIKDQDGAMGSNIGQLENAVAGVLKGYDGDVAVMSFNPNTVALMARLLPDTPRGLVTGSFLEKNWDLLPSDTRQRLREIPDFDTVKASFISHKVDDLDRARVSEIRATGSPVLCWTVRNPQTEALARTKADNITFEDYLPGHQTA